jgi:hypothetical protein
MSKLYDAWKRVALGQPDTRKQIEDLEKDMANFRASFNDLIEKRREAAERKNLASLRTTGIIIHKDASEYSVEDECTRYLVISDHIWLEIDDDNQPISTEPADPYGRVHSEKACRRTR